MTSKAPSLGALMEKQPDDVYKALGYKDASGRWTEYGIDQFARSLRISFPHSELSSIIGQLRADLARCRCREAQP